jgi:hypothetical protein
MPNLQAGEGKRPTPAMSVSLLCVGYSYARVMVGKHLPEHSDDRPEIDRLLQQELLLFRRTTFHRVTEPSLHNLLSWWFIYDGILVFKSNLRKTN